MTPTPPPPPQQLQLTDEDLDEITDSLRPRLRNCIRRVLMEYAGSAGFSVAIRGIMEQLPGAGFMVIIANALTGIVLKATCEGVSTAEKLRDEKLRDEAISIIKDGTGGEPGKPN